MAILKQLINAGPYTTQCEIWDLENGLIFEINFGDYIDVSISSTTGDVSDQIFEKLNNLEKYSSMKLLSLGCYFIQIDKHMLKDLMKDVETIDSKSLRQGKIY